MEQQTELLGTIEKIIREVVNNQTLAVKFDSKLSDDLGLESIDLLDVSSELENVIGREIDFREVADFSKKRTGQAANMRDICVQDLIEYIGLAN